MKDYLANELRFEIWKDILRRSLPDIAENIIDKIKRDNKSDYDRSFAVIRKLVKTHIIASASQMQEIIRPVHYTFSEQFRKKFIEG